MADTIKGLKYVVDIDGSKFEGTMKDLNNILASTKREINSLDKALKIDPGNVEVLEQKFKATEKAISLTKNKSEDLEKKLQSLKGADVLDQKAIARTQAELTKVTTELKKLESEKAEISVKLKGDISNEVSKIKADVKEVNSKDIDIDTSKSKKNVDGLKDTFDVLKSSMKLPDLSIAGGVATGMAVLGTSIKQVADEYQSINKLTGALGISKEEARQYKDVAVDLWRNGFGENVNESVEAVAKVKQQFRDLDANAVKNLTQDFLTASSVVGEDFNDVLKTSSVMMKQFGIDGQEATDIIIAMTQQGGNYSGELLDTLREYSPQFKAMGFSAGEMAKILVEGAKAGAFNLDKVGDAMKEFNIRAKDGSKSTSEAFTDLKLNADEMGQAIAQGGDKGKNAFRATIVALSQVQDKQKQAEIGVKLFGTQWEDLEATTVKALSGVTGELDGVKGATQRVKDVANDDPFKKFENSFKTLRTELSKGLGNAMPGITQFFDGLSKLDVSQMIEGIAKAFSGVGKAIGNAIKANPKEFAQGLLVLIAGGIFMATVGLPGLIAGLALMFLDGLISSFAGDDWKNKLGESIANGFKGALTAITNFATWIWETIVAGLDALWQSFYDKGSFLIGGIVDALKTIGGAVVGFATWLTDGIAGGITGIFQWFYDKGTWLVGSITGALKTIGGAVAGFGGWLWNGAVGGLNGIWQWFWDKGSWLVGGVTSGLRTVGGAVSGFGGWLWNGISGGLGNVWNFIWDKVSGFSSAINSGFQSAINNVGNVGQWLWNKVSGGFNWVKDRVGDFFNSLNPFRSLDGVDLKMMTSMHLIPEDIGTQARSIGYNGTGGSFTTTNVTNRPVFNINVNADKNNSIDDLVEEIQLKLGGLIYG